MDTNGRAATSDEPFVKCPACSAKVAASIPTPTTRYVCPACSTVFERPARHEASFADDANERPPGTDASTQLVRRLFTAAKEILHGWPYPPGTPPESRDPTMRHCRRSRPGAHRPASLASRVRTRRRGGRSP